MSESFKQANGVLNRNSGYNCFFNLGFLMLNIGLGQGDFRVWERVFLREKMLEVLPGVLVSKQKLVRLSSSLPVVVLLDLERKRDLVRGSESVF